MTWTLPSRDLWCKTGRDKKTVVYSLSLKQTSLENIQLPWQSYLPGYWGGTLKNRGSVLRHRGVWRSLPVGGDPWPELNLGRRAVLAPTAPAKGSGKQGRRSVASEGGS